MGVRTDNIVGSQNVIEARVDAGVKKVVALSTDKASSPINLHGATKPTADKLFITGNHYAAAPHPVDRLGALGVNVRSTYRDQCHGGTVARRVI